MISLENVNLVDERELHTEIEVEDDYIEEEDKKIEKGYFYLFCIFLTINNL